LHKEIPNLACTDVLMNPHRTLKTRSIWPTLGSESPEAKSGTE